MFIRSERLFLRPAWPEDWHDVEAAFHGAPAAPWPTTPESFCVLPASPAERLLPRLLVTLPQASGAAIVGGAGLSAGLGAAPEIGFRIAPDHRGQGYASEAVRALVGLARALGHRRILARPPAGDPASLRVLAKSGFRAADGAGLRRDADGSAGASALVYVVDLAVSDDGDDGMRRAA